MELNKIYQGDALSVLKTFPSESIDLICTSPPYYGLRDYGIEGQIGQEKTPQEYIQNLMKIMDECKRVLKKTGSLWVNIGDSYGGTGSKGNYKDPKYEHGRNADNLTISSKLSPKSLLGIPERFVIAMTDNNWIRRNSIIWYKPNCMPSSAKDRFTVDFEYFYFFTKSKKYFFETQYEPSKDPEDDVRRMLRHKNYNNVKNDKRYFGDTLIHNKQSEEQLREQFMRGRIKRCVWKITLQPYKEAHFATFPEALIETPIKACCPPNGVVLDPFMGAGTTGLVAKKLGRNYLGIELNEEYIKIANKRINSIL